MLDKRYALIIEEVLREALPGPSAMVGRANVRDIAAFGGDVCFSSMEGASRLDWAAPLALLASAAAVSSHAVAIIKSLRERRKGDDQKLGVEIKMSIPQELQSKLDSATVEKLIEKLLKRF
jgi:hypothetical protein